MKKDRGFLQSGAGRPVGAGETRSAARARRRGAIGSVRVGGEARTQR